MTTVLCFIDTETTGLDPSTQEAYEVCWWREDAAEPTTGILPHSLAGADEKALEIGGYRRRGVTPGWHNERRSLRRRLRNQVAGVTLVGSNPAFDAAFLRKTLGCAPWHHRLVNVAEGGMWVFGWDRPKGLLDVANECRTRGYEIPEPDHTAEGDVRATRAVYEALRSITKGGAAMSEPDLPAYTYAGRKPDNERCDECGDPTKSGSALCGICAWNRYDDQLAEWWDRNPLPERDEEAS